MNDEALQTIVNQIEGQMNVIAKDFGMKIIESRRGEGSHWIFYLSQAPNSFFGSSQQQSIYPPNNAMISDLDALRNRLTNTIAPMAVRYENNSVAFVVDVSDMVDRASRLGRILYNDLDKGVTRLTRIRQEEEYDARLTDKERKKNFKLDKKLKKENKTRSFALKTALFMAFVIIVYLSLKLIAQ